MVSPKQTHQFLIFQLAIDIQAMLSTECLGEVLKCEVSQIVPILDMPKPVMGVSSNRGEVLWLVDLSLLLELTPLYALGIRQYYDVMVMHYKDRVAGFAVPKVGQLVNYRVANMQPPILENLPGSFGRCLDGLYRRSQGKDTLVLNTAKLFDLLKKIPSNV
ncbi:chemotaxis protein CheW [Altericista sp. CCNU0014]|uniref:chemotaxis protein CheW n=1 Tax=Altericista sp. CCNU0014 TaxID=3082949 RepID=UPI00384DF413